MQGFPLFNTPTFWFGTVALLLSLSAWFFDYKKTALALLLLGGLALRLWASLLDPFIHTWDEAWHAIVGKNFLLDPLVPRLRPEALLPYDPTLWCCNHYWLHKPPLTMWQIAASVKLFGTSVFALRLPSVLLGAVQILLTYRIGKIAVNERTGYLAAFLFATSFYHLELTSGNQPLELNDIAIIFYLTASIWSLCEYHRSGSWKWVLLTGLLAGLAVLTKWMIGMLVFAGWAVGLAWELLRSKKIPWAEAGRFGVAAAVAVAVFLPWDLYTAHRFPVEHAFEKAYNWQHIFEPVENHVGGPDYFFNMLPDYFFPYAWVPLLAGLGLFLYRQRDLKLAVTLVSMCLGVWFFFSFVAQTKMFSYGFYVAAILFLFLAVLMDALFDFLEKHLLPPPVFQDCPCPALHPARPVEPAHAGTE